MLTEAHVVQYRRLDTLADVTAGITLGQDFPSGSSIELPYLRVANVQDGFITTNDVKTLRLPLTLVDRFRLESGDVLLTEGGDFDKLGRSAVWGGQIDPCLHQNHVLRVRCFRLELLPEFLTAYLASPEGRAYFLKISKQTTNLATISLSQLRSMPIPWLSIDEQRKIVETMEAIDGLIGHESRTSAKQAALLEGFTEAALTSHMKDYELVRLGDMSVGGSKYGSNSPATKNMEDCPRYVRITDIGEDGELRSDPPGGHTGLPWRVAGPYILQSGDLLIARTGFTVGKSYLYRPEDGVCAYAGYLVRFRIDDERMLPDYAFLWTRGNAFKKWVAENIREVGQRNISGRDYETHSLPLPPICVQREFVGQWRQVRASVQACQRKVSKLQELRKALVRDLLTSEGRVKARALL
jgi:type I restriction enzyme S subunit